MPTRFLFHFLAATLLPVFQCAAQQTPAGATQHRYDLNGEWRAGFTVGAPELQIEKIMIQQIGDKVIATKITGDEYVPAGKVTVRGTYTRNPFSGEQVCALRGYQKPHWATITMTVIDSKHFKTDGGCSGSAVWERVGDPTLALDSAVLFGVDNYDLKADAEDTLRKITEFLSQNHPDSHLLVAGYTDDVGSDAHNLELSARRAQSVASWLEAHGVESSRVKTKGFGKTNPRFPNTNTEARAHNRRVEIVVQD